MTIGAVLAALALATGAWAEEIGQMAERTVRVCFRSDPDLPTSSPARKMASKMFAAIGVRIEWHRNEHACAPGDGSIVIDLTYDTLDAKFPGAFAYALPYEGTHIVVFLDRVVGTVGRCRASLLLAHVLVHEITHIVQGVSRHSKSGIMKAQWGQGDLFDMERKPLAFTPEDVILIHNGLDERASRMGRAAGMQ